MNHRARTVLAPAVLVLALGLAACNGDEPAGRTADATADATATATETVTATPTEDASAEGGTDEVTTIAEYLAAEGVEQVPLGRDDDGPVIDLPVPDGWRTSEDYAEAASYGAIVSEDAADPADPPRVLALLARLEGEVDPARILELAPGELQELDGFVPIELEQESTLGAYDAAEVAGSLTTDGRELVVVQKTVVIPTDDGLHVLQLNAYAPAAEEDELVTALTLINAQTTITP